MIEPLVKRTDDEARRKQYSTIKTTPESIVQIYRLQKARREPVENPYIFTPKRPRIPWYQKINWFDCIVAGVLYGSCAVVVAVAIYVVGWHIIPFVETLRWG